MHFGSRQGQGLVEYTLILILAVVVVVVAVTVLGHTTAGRIGNASELLVNAGA